jgi:hypothetical protein
MPRISTWLRDTAGMRTMSDDLIFNNTGTPENKFTMPTNQPEQGKELPMKDWNTRLKKLPSYGWTKDGMKQKPASVPMEDRFVMRQQVLNLVSQLQQQLSSLQSELLEEKRCKESAMEYVETQKKEMQSLSDSLAVALDLLKDCNDDGRGTLTLADRPMLIKKINFYRSETDKVREYIFANNIGEPNQKLWDAILDRIKYLESENSKLISANELAAEEITRLENEVERLKEIIAIASEQVNFKQFNNTLTEVKNYFGEHDKTTQEHRLYADVLKLKKALTEIVEIKSKATSTQDLFPVLQAINKAEQALKENELKELKK